MKPDEKNTEIYKENFDELCSLISSCHDEEFIKEFFYCLFTPAERIDFAQRWLLVKELKAGKTQRTIAKDYSMSLCKITRGSRELQKEGNAFSKMLALLEEKKSGKD